jgi:4-amino-4-deoxy-L-arabinose transferase-like glycosyltransferase
MKHVTLPRILLVFCVGFTLFLMFYNLGKAPLENWDEAWYAEVTKQMLRTHEFIVLQWNHAIWLDKPPMYFWLSALFSGIFGLSEFSVRLPSAISGAVIIVLVSAYAYRLYGLIPAFLAFVSLALNNLFIWRARSGNIDVFVSLLIFITYFLMIGKYRYKYPLLGVIFGCIFLTKASLVMFPLVVFIIYELVFNSKEIKKLVKSYLQVVLWFVLLSGLWLAAGYFKEGYAFVSYYLFQSDQNVASLAFNNFNLDYINHAYYSLQRRYFWLFLLGIILAVVYYKRQKEFLFVLYGTFLLLQLSFTQKDNNWYLIPSMPFWSLLIAYATHFILKLTRNNKIVIIFILAAVLYTSYKTFTGHILPLLDTGSAYSQAQSSKLLNTLTKKEDVIVRLDHLYPTTIYYADRKALASPPGATETKLHWISRKDLLTALQEKQITWLIGSTDAVKQFQMEAGTIPLTLRQVNNDEVIVEVVSR